MVRAGYANKERFEYKALCGRAPAATPSHAASRTVTFVEKCGRYCGRSYFSVRSLLTGRSGPRRRNSRARNRSTRPGSLDSVGMPGM